MRQVCCDPTPGNWLSPSVVWPREYRNLRLGVIDQRRDADRPSSCPEVFVQFSVTLVVTIVAGVPHQLKRHIFLNSTGEETLQLEPVIHRLQQRRFSNSVQVISLLLRLLFLFQLLQLIDKLERPACGSTCSERRESFWAQPLLFLCASCVYLKLTSSFLP